MKLRLLTAIFGVCAITACAVSTKTQIADPVPGDGTTPPDGMTTPAPDDDDVANQPPHSLGTILLGESHASGASKSTPLVSATFWPDALLTRACTTKVEAGCTIQKAAKCTKVSTTTTGCNSNEVCALDNTTCSAVCQPYTNVVCSQACSTDEICKADGTGTGTGTGTTNGTCVKVESFDAGPIAFMGTTTSITMFPPYKFDVAGQDGAPFLGGSEIRVQASGATVAGFDKFDEKFNATTFIQTTPSLAKISRDKVFGSGALPIAWAPANDQIVITLTGAGGSATCKANDMDGKFDVPRSVVQAIQGDGTTTTTASSSISISVARQHRDVKKDKHAKGQLAGVTAKPDGWLELITLSSESASFQGCPTNQTICNGADSACTDLSYDRYNCGTCGNACTSSQSCSSGKCIGGSSSGTSGSSGGTSCTTCRSNAAGGSCSSQYNACSADANCDNLYFCQDNCTTSSCVSSCESSYPSGFTKWSPLKSCLTTYCSSSCGF